MAASQQRLTQLGLSRDPYRVMLVDDSIIFRTMFRRLLQDHMGVRAADSESADAGNTPARRFPGLQ